MRWWERKEEIRGCSLGCRAAEYSPFFIVLSIALGSGIVKGIWERESLNEKDRVWMIYDVSSRRREGLSTNS